MSGSNLTHVSQAMLLAAGLGTRLWPLTADRAKPAVPFLGRPLVDGCVALLARHEIPRAVVNTHYRAASIRAALPEERPHGVDVAFSHEEEILGTAGGLALARDRGLLDAARHTLIVNAKLHTDLDLGDVLEAHHASGAAVTMVLRTNVEREAFREVLVSDGWVRGFGEGRVPKGERPLLFTGVHVISPEVLRSLEPRFSDTVADVYPPLIAAGRVRAHVDDRGRWWEFSTVERYLGLHHRASAEGFGADVVLGEGARVAPVARVSRSVLWEGASVAAGAEVDACVLGAGVHVPEGAKLQRVAVVRKDRVGDVERGTVVGDNVHVPISAPP